MAILNLHKLPQNSLSFQNGGVTWRIVKFNVLGQVGIALNNANCPPLILKPLQICKPEFKSLSRQPAAPRAYFRPFLSQENPAQERA